METSDYPLSEVPKTERKGLLSTSVVLLGFTFFTSTMWAGGTLGKAFSFSELMLAILRITSYNVCYTKLLRGNPLASACESALIRWASATSCCR